MSDPNLIADLAAAGLDPMLLQRVALEIGRARAAMDAIERRRTADKDRQAKRRHVTSRDNANGAALAVEPGHVMSRDVTLQHVTPQTSTDEPPNDPSPLPPHTPPITPTPNTPGSDPSGSAAPSAATDPDPRRDLFGRGKATVRRMTGRSNDQCGSLLGKWLRLANDSAVIVLASIDEAETKELANPVPWIEQSIRREMSDEQGFGRPSARQSSFGGRQGSLLDAVSAGVAGAAARRGIGPGAGPRDLRPDDRRASADRADDPRIVDADWTPTPSDRYAHRRA